MPERPVHGNSLQQILPVGILLKTLAVPVLHHFLGFFQIVRLQRYADRLRVFSAEPVHMVALFLEFPPLEIGQIIDGIDVVKPVPVRANQEFPGKPVFQLLRFRFCHAGNPAGNAPLPGIRQNPLQRRPPVPGAHGVGIDAFPVEMGEKNHAIREKHPLLTAPQVHIGKGVLTAPAGAGKEDFLVVFLLRQFQPLKFDH